MEIITLLSVRVNVLLLILQVTRIMKEHIGMESQRNN